MIDLEVIESTECSCRSCVAYCKYKPGTPTPDEARKLMALGYAKRLGLDWFETDDDEIEMIAPAIEGHEGERYPWWPEGTCTFLNEQERCEIHDSGAKPIICRKAHHASNWNQIGGLEINAAIAKLWDTDEGRAVVEEWKQTVWS